VKTRAQFVGLVFEGFIQIDQEGTYTFYLPSDDGSRLYLNNTPPLLTILGTHLPPAPEEILVKQPAGPDGGPHFVTAEGRLTFLGRQQDNRTELELTSDDAHMRVLVLDSAAPSNDLLDAQVRLYGVSIPALDNTGHSLADLLVIPSWQNVECLPDAATSAFSPVLSPANSNQLSVLTTAAQVQHLTRDAARRAFPVQLKGVVTWLSEHRDCVVLQDATRGVFVGLRDNWALDAPKPGDLLEIEGYCNAAEFSPIVILTNGLRLGRGLFPAPLHPSWEQLIGGSLDDQYIEISGLVTASRDTNHFTLLMPGGKAEIEFDQTPAAPLESFLHSVVRIRGVMFANWDADTHMVTPSRPLRFGSAVICEDVPPPADPFSADRMRAPQLMQFDVRRNTFQRVKVCGQLLCQRGGMSFLTDQGFGFRVELAKPVSLAPGDMLDVVGLVELGGPSPVLREAIARKLSHLPLPEPGVLALDLTNNLRDSTRVVAEGVLLGVKDTGADKVLELQSVLNHFAARLPAECNIPWAAGSRLKLTGTLSAVNLATTAGQHANSIELLLNSPADVQLLARPPWWTLGRLLTMVAILTLGLGLAFVWINLLRAQVERRTRQLRREISERQRAEQERAIETERTRIALDLHDDLGSRITAISMLATNGLSSQRSAAASQERLQLIADKARLMVTTLDGLVWTVDPKNDTLASLAEYLASFAEEFLAKTGIACQVDLPREFPARSVSAEARHNVLLAVQEALNNAVRHGDPDQISLRLVCSANALSIVLRDDGHGFDLKDVTMGNGLANLHERLRKANGRCQIESSPGQGTTIVLTLPF
jgi:signal transduction histidine kinase